MLVCDVHTAGCDDVIWEEGRGEGREEGPTYIVVAVDREASHGQAAAWAGST